MFVDGPYGMNKYPGDVLTAETAQLYRSVFERAHGQLIVCGTFISLSWLWVSAWPALPYRSCVVWHKLDWVGGSVKNIVSFAPRHELLLHFSADSAPFYADAVRTPYGERAAAGVAKKTGRSHGWVPNPLGARRGDVWTITSDRLANKVDGRTQANVHPCVKPVELLEVCVLATTKEGDVVDEPFVGSDNLKQVCERLGRVYRGWPNAATPPEGA